MIRSLLLLSEGNSYRLEVIYHTRYGTISMDSKHEPHN
jgi:hypothetical protein